MRDRAPQGTEIPIAPVRSRGARGPLALEQRARLRPCRYRRRRAYSQRGVHLATALRHAGEAVTAMMLIRDAGPRDMTPVTALVNAHLDTTTVSWTDVPETVQQRKRWLERQQHDGNAVLVATTMDEVIGFATYGDFRDSVKWPGYRFVVEHSIHIAEEHWGRGIGRLLMEELISRAKAHGKTQMVGAVDAANEASIRFHRQLGFEEVGRLPQIGFKLDRWLDLVLLQRPV